MRGLIGDVSLEIMARRRHGCAAKVNAGQPLTDPQIQQLLDDLGRLIPAYALAAHRLRTVERVLETDAGGVFLTRTES